MGGIGGGAAGAKVGSMVMSSSSSCMLAMSDWLTTEERLLSRGDKASGRKASSSSASPRVSVLARWLDSGRDDGVPRGRGALPFEDRESVDRVLATAAIDVRELAAPPAVVFGGIVDVLRPTELVAGAMLGLDLAPVETAVTPTLLAGTGGVPVLEVAALDAPLPPSLPSCFFGLLNPPKSLLLLGVGLPLLPATPLILLAAAAS